MRTLWGLSDHEVMDCPGRTNVGVRPKINCVFVVSVDPNELDKASLISYHESSHICSPVL
jgi:hypothetical protein